MEIRAALGQHFVGFNTGRWDYINSVSDAMAWDPDFVNPNIDAITMTYGYMRNYEDRVRRAVQHARPARPVRALAGRHGAEHSGRLRGRRRERHEARVGRRRARAARGRQRQVGRALEDGAHRPAGVGAGRRGQPARTRVPAAHLHAGRRRRADPARAGAAHRPRRARSAERRPAVRQRLRAGLAGGRAQAGRLLRQRRRALPDGRHGDRRDPPQHPLGVAAQGRAASPTTTPRPASRPATASTRRCSRGCSPRSTRSCATPATATSTTTRRRRRCRSRARSSTTYVTDGVKLPWYIDLLNINLDNRDLATARTRIQTYIEAFERDGTRITENLDF